MGLVLAEPGYWASTVAPALGALRCLRSSSSTSWWWRLSWSTSSCASLRRILEFCLFLWVARALRTWKMVYYPPAPCFWQPFLGVWVLLVDYGTLDSSGDDFVRGAMLRLTLDTGLETVLGFWEDFTYFLRRCGLAEWRSMLSRCFDLSPCTRSSPLEYRHYFYQFTSLIRVMMWGIFRAQCAFFGLPRQGLSPQFSAN